MTHPRELLREAVLRSNLRSVAKDVGFSHQTLADYLADPDKTSQKTQGKAQAWADRQAGGDVPRGTPPELVPYWLREWEQMQAEPGLTGIARQLRISELNATLRDYAVAKLAEAASRAEESAAARARAAEHTAPTPPAPIQPAPRQAPSERRRTG